MKYELIYQNLINNARNKTYDIFETHHIIPRCMGGSNIESNLVKLSPREHAFAHLLLVKIHPSVTMLVHAAGLMFSKSPSTRYRSTKEVGWLREKYKNSVFECPHCNTKGKAPVIFRWHFDSCKYKKNHTKRTHNYDVVKCPHCNKEGKGPNMGRYHFDNCKVLTNKTFKFETVTCPHCNRDGAGPGFIRSHFENCKSI